jgi:hypothetical protein
MLSLLMQRMHIYFLDFAQLKDLLLLMVLKPKKGATMINTPLINSSLWQLRFLDASTNKLMSFYTTVNTNWSFRRLEGPPLSILVTFLHKKKFQLHYKRCKHTPSLSRAIAIGLATSGLPPI